MGNEKKQLTDPIKLNTVKRDAWMKYKKIDWNDGKIRKSPLEFNFVHHTQRLFTKKVI